MIEINETTVELDPAIVKALKQSGFKQIGTSLSYAYRLSPYQYKNYKLSIEHIFANNVYSEGIRSELLVYKPFFDPMTIADYDILKDILVGVFNSRFIKKHMFIDKELKGIGELQYTASYGHNETAKLLTDIKRSRAGIDLFARKLKSLKPSRGKKL